MENLALRPNSAFKKMTLKERKLPFEPRNATIMYIYSQTRQIFICLSLACCFISMIFCLKAQKIFTNHVDLLICTYFIVITLQCLGLSVYQILISKKDSYFEKLESSHTAKFMSEALIFASTNPQYDNRLFIELPVQYIKN